MTTICIIPHDPLIIKDGRPFVKGDRVHCLNWPYPSLVAGSLRSLLGKAMIAGGEYRSFQDDDLLARLKGVSVAGPFPMVEQTLFFPAPRDILCYREGRQRRVMTLKPAPLGPGEGCDLPNTDLWPVVVTEDCKPDEENPVFWSANKIVQWLTANPPADWNYPQVDDHIGAAQFLQNFEKEMRTNVGIKPDTFVSEDALLFSTEGIVLHVSPSCPAQIAIKVESADSSVVQHIAKLKQMHPLGGERRVAEFSTVADNICWHCPDSLEHALQGSSHVRMVLATPAIFSQGWLPGWLDGKTLEGVLPESDIRLKLRGACVDRWRPISGWSLEQGKRGPKPVRRLVPSGSVYFFEIIQGNPRKLAELWLRSVCDLPQDRLDGFGLAVWGVWSNTENSERSWR